MSFVLDDLSLQKLKGVHNDLVRVVVDCAQNFGNEFRFGVSQGLRTIAEQETDVAAHKSTTMKSRHLDGHAVDLAAITLKGHIAWDWPLYFKIAEAMKGSSVRLGVPMNWGGCWDMELSKLGDDMEHETAQYIIRAKARGQRGFTDGPHFQLDWVAYPSAKA